MEGFRRDNEKPILHTVHLLLAPSRPLPPLLPTPDKHVPLLRRTPLHLHKLIKLQYPPLTTRPALGALMENRMAGVVNTFLSLSRRARSRRRSHPARPSSTYRIGRNGKSGIILVGFGLLRWRFGCGGRLRLWGAWGGSRDSETWRWRGCLVICWRGSWNGGIVNGGVFPRCAGRDGEEFVKRQHAGFAAFPACRKGRSQWIWAWRYDQEEGGGGAQTPFWPSWKMGGPGW